MGNKFTFILKYNKYIKNIKTSTNSEDIEISKEMSNQRLVEGLITTHPGEKTISILKNKFNEMDIIWTDDGEMEIKLKKDYSINKYLPLINNLGYFISQSFDTISSNWIKGFKDNQITSAFDIEPKYDSEIINTPEYLFHITNVDFLDRILKNGLIPKSQSKLSYHPDRVYLTDNKKVIEDFSNYILDTYSKEPITLKIDTKKLNIKLYQDVNMLDGGYYTLDNINPNSITIF